MDDKREERGCTGGDGLYTSGSPASNEYDFIFDEDNNEPSRATESGDLELIKSANRNRFRAIENNNEFNGEVESSEAERVSSLLLGMFGRTSPIRSS